MRYFDPPDKTQSVSLPAAQPAAGATPLTDDEIFARAERERAEGKMHDLSELDEPSEATTPQAERLCNCGSHKLAPLYHKPDCPEASAAQHAVAPVETPDETLDDLQHDEGCGCAFADTLGHICGRDVEPPSVEWSRNHLAHVQRFLCEMYQTMVDPVDEFRGNIAELCELLLKRAREDREILNASQPDVETRLTAEQFWPEWSQGEGLVSYSNDPMKVCRLKFAEAFRDKSESELRVDNKRAQAAEGDLMRISEALNQPGSHITPIADRAIAYIAGLREEIERLKGELEKLR